MAATELALDVAAMGSEPVTSLLPASVEIVVDPAALPPEGGTRVTCTDGAPLEICADAVLRPPVIYATPESVVVWFSSREMLTESVLLEIVPDGAEGPFGRIFVRDFTDAARPGTPRTCAPFHRVTVAGMARLSTIDPPADTVHGVLDVSLNDDHHMRLEF